MTDDAAYFKNLAGWVDAAWSQPGVAANPDVAVVLHLLCEGVMVLARRVVKEGVTDANERVTPPNTEEPTND